MSTLSSLVKSGKRKIVKTKTGQPSVEEERERDDIETQQKSPEVSGSKTPILSALGRADQGVSTDATRPQQDMLNPNDQTALGRPDRSVSKDPTRPQ